MKALRTWPIVWWWKNYSLIIPKLQRPTTLTRTTPVSLCSAPLAMSPVSEANQWPAPHVNCAPTQSDRHSLYDLVTMCSVCMLPDLAGQMFQRYSRYGTHIKKVYIFLSRAWHWLHSEEVFFFKCAELSTLIVGWWRHDYMLPCLRCYEWM